MRQRKIGKVINTILIIISVLFLSVLLLPFYVDINAYKPQILAKAKEALGRDINVEGRFTLSLLPRPSLTMEKLHLSNLQGGTRPDMMVIEKINLTVSILPLFKKEIEFYAIKAEDIDIFLEKLPSGKPNWDFSSFKPYEAASPDLLFPPGSPLYQKFSKFVLSIKDLLVTKGRLHYKLKNGVYEVNDLSSKITFSSNDLLSFLMGTAHSVEKPLEKFKSSSGGTSLQWPADPLDLGFLDHFDISVLLKAKNIMKNDMILDNLSVKASVRKGILKIEEAQGQLYKGNLRINGQTDGQNHNKSDYSFSIKEADLKQIIPSNRPIRIKQGLFTLEGQITSEGNSLYHLMAGLDGKIMLHTSDVMVSGLNLQALTSNLMKQNRLEGIIGLLTSSFTEGQTLFSIPSGYLEIHKGLATIKNLKLLAKDAEGRFEGSIDLLKYIMNVRGVFRLTALKDVPPLSIEFKGPLDAPKCLINSTDLQWYIVLSLLNIPRGVLELFGMGATKTSETLGSIINKLLLD